jgi:regulator of replication initiation timing
MERTDDDVKQQVNQLTARLHEKTTENASLRLDNDRLKVGSWFVFHAFINFDSKYDTELLEVGRPFAVHV